MKKILIALDYDPTAQKVAEKGYAFATSMNAEVVLVHVMADPIYYASSIYTPLMGFGGYVGMDFLEADIVQGLKDESRIFLDKVKLHLEDTTIQTIIAEGDIAEAIISTAKDVHADVIVMGTHSRQWLESILVGSVTEKVIKHTATNLLLVPTKQSN